MDAKGRHRVVGVLLLAAAAALWAGPIETLQPGHWYEAPSSHLADSPEKALQSQFPWLASNFGAILDTWDGGAFDTQRDRMLVGPGGGHASYNGNEVYGFDLNTLVWKRLTNPDPIESGECTNDSVPFAMHTYDGGDYMPPPVDRYLLVGGWCTAKTYALNEAARHWEIFPSSGMGRTGDASAYNPLTGLLYFVPGQPPGGIRMGSFNYKTGIWTVLNASSPTDLYTTGTIDFKRNLLITVGGGMVRVWDLNKSPVQYATQSTTGDNAAVGANNPGAEYDPVSDRVVCWFGGADVYSLNTVTWVWTKNSPAGSNAVVPPAQLGNGTYGRFRYVPSKNVFALVNNVAQNVFVYRLTAAIPVIPVRLDATLQGTLEAGLSYSVTAKAIYSDSSQPAVSDSLFLRALNSQVVSIVSGNSFQAKSTGSASIIAGYTDRRLGRAVYDTLNVTVNAISGTVVLDSIVLNYRQGGVLVSDSTALHATGFYTRGSDHYSLDIDQIAAWTSGSPSNLTVSGGVIHGSAAGGPFNLTASLSGKSDTAQVTVYSAPPITRINFQVTSTPYKAGWLADNGGAYSDAQGYGWIGASGLTARDDRLGNNFLLKSLVQPSVETPYKVKLTDGRYVLRLALGDNQWGTAFTYIRMGTDTLITFFAGPNSIVTRTVTVTGGNGLNLNVDGAFNYLVVMPDNGMDISRYADDGYSPPPMAVASGITEAIDGEIVSVYPNPFHSRLEIQMGSKIPNSRLTILDVRGKSVAELSEIKGRGTHVIWEPKNLPAGVYFLKVSSGKKQSVQRILMLK